MRTLLGESRVLKNDRAPDSAEPTGLLRARVVGAVGALEGPGAEHKQNLLKDSFHFGITGTP